MLDLKWLGVGTVVETSGESRWIGSVLLVEDEEPLRNLLTTYLKRRGYGVQAVGSSEEALELGQPFEVLVSDVMLPGETGVVLARKLALSASDLRVVFITGYADAEINLDIPPPHWILLPKPFKLSALEQAISRVRLAPD